MDGRIEITESEVWAEIDKWFRSEREPDEYDAKYFMKRYNMKIASTKKRLFEMEAAGILTSRQILDNGTIKWVWKFANKPKEEQDQEE